MVLLPVAKPKRNVMKDDRRKIKEPFEPKDTPKPPQIIEPNSGRKRENPVQDQKRNKTEPGNAAAEKEEQHLLGDDADISDETTI
jgi:hypothetical protein